MDKRLTIGAPGREAMEKVIAIYKEYYPGKQQDTVSHRVKGVKSRLLIFHRDDASVKIFGGDHNLEQR